MGILELAMENPENPADKDFIEKALHELESYITYLEQKHQIILVGDRADFNKARHDWLHLTKIQVAFAVSDWKSGIFMRYQENINHL